MLKREDQDLAERRLDRLISGLPSRLAAVIRWLRHPSRVWLRIPLGAVLFFGGFLAVLPIFGMWMTPLGLILVAQDFGPIRRGIYRLINWTAERRPHWFGEQAA